MPNQAREDVIQIIKKVLPLIGKDIASMQPGELLKLHNETVIEGLKIQDSSKLITIYHPDKYERNLIEINEYLKTPSQELELNEKEKEYLENGLREVNLELIKIKNSLQTGSKKARPLKPEVKNVMLQELLGLIEANNEEKLKEFFEKNREKIDVEFYQELSEKNQNILEYVAYSDNFEVVRIVGCHIINDFFEKFADKVFEDALKKLEFDLGNLDESTKNHWQYLFTMKEFYKSDEKTIFKNAYKILTTRSEGDGAAFKIAALIDLGLNCDCVFDEENSNGLVSAINLPDLVNRASREKVIDDKNATLLLDILLQARGSKRPRQDPEEPEAQPFKKNSVCEIQ